MKDLENLVNNSIPYLLIPFSIIVVIDLIFDLSEYLIFIMVVDFIIIIILASDLYFKYRGYKAKKDFFRDYWIDFLALVPYYLYFRLIKLVRLARVTNFFTRIKLNFIAKLKTGHKLSRKKK